jgi:hypothetical protein
MIDWTKPVQTRDGRKARVICRDLKHEHYSVVALIEDDDCECVETYRDDGGYWSSSTAPDDISTFLKM